MGGLEKEKKKWFKCEDVVAGCCDRFYHIDDHFPERLSLLVGQIAEYVAVGVLQQFERHGQMMVLQHRFVVVQQSQFGA